MTRKNLLIIAYFLIVLMLFSLSLFLKYTFKWPNGSLFIVAFLFFLPSRVASYYWRDLIRGVRCLHKQKYSLAIDHVQSFLLQLKRRPWIKHFIWICPSFWTISAQALAMNNLGAALLESGDLTEAKIIFIKALKYDSKYPIPHYNLAIIATLQEDLVSASEHFTASMYLGFNPNSTFDRFLHTVKKLYARFEPMA